MSRKTLAILGVAAALAAGAAIWFFTRPETKVEAPKVEAPRGPDPGHLAKIEALATKVQDLEQQGKFEEALAVLKDLAALDPRDPRVGTLKPRLEEKLGRLKAWRGAHEKAQTARAYAAKSDAAADWQKVLDFCAEAEKHAPTEEHTRLTRELALVARQNLLWVNARAEEKKGSLRAALDLATQAAAVRETSPELAAFKVSLEKKIKKQEFDKLAASARAEAVAARAYELWKQAKGLAEDSKDVEEVDRRLDQLLPRVDMAERDRRFDAAVKAGDQALAAGDLDQAEKSFRAAHALKGTDLKPGQALLRVAQARKLKAYDSAMVAGRAAEEKKEWSDAIDAYDQALKMKPGDAAATQRRKEVEETYRPARIDIVLDAPTGIKMEFVLIKRGKFLMGDEKGRPDEKPHEVTIAKDFYMHATEVTQKQWELIMQKRPFSFTGGPDLPADSVSWEDVHKFTENMNATAKDQMKGRRMALPTEAEWEYACRAGSTSHWNYGDDETALDDSGWFTRNSNRAPKRVGKKRPNAWGLFDMHGNLSEWCEDAYASDPSKSAEAAAVEDAPRVIRGGSWNDRAVNCRSATREKESPGKGSIFVGFRPVLR